MFLSICRIAFFAALFFALLTVEFHTFNKSAISETHEKGALTQPISTLVQSVRPILKKSIDPNQI